MNIQNWRSDIKGKASKYIEGVRNTGVAKDVDCMDALMRFNSNVDYVVRESLTALDKAYALEYECDKQSMELSKRIKEYDVDIANIQSAIANAESNKDAEIHNLIIKAQQDAVRNAKVYTDEQLADVKAELDRLNAEKDNVTAPKTLEQVREELFNNVGSEGAVAKAAVDALSYFNSNYGEFQDSGDGKWSEAFSKIYTNAVNEAQQDTTKVIEATSKYRTAEDIHSYVATAYKRNPYAMVKLLLYMFALPIAQIKYQYSNPNIFKCIVTLIQDIATGYKRPQRIIATVFMVVEWYLLLTQHIGITIVTFVVLGTLIACFFVGRKKFSEQIREMALVYVSYEQQVGGIDETANAAYYKLLEEAKQEAMIKYANLANKYNAMLEENEQAMNNAKNSFDASKIDKSRLESEYRDRIADWHNQVTTIKEAQKAYLRDIEKLKETKAGRTNNKNEVIKETLNKIIGTAQGNNFKIDGHDFSLLEATADALAMVKTRSKRNVFGRTLTLTGYKLNNGEILSEELPPANFLISVQEVNLKQDYAVCSKFNEVFDIMQNILDTAAGFMQNRYSKSPEAQELVPYMNLNKIYKLRLAPYSMKCSLVIYDSRKDPNYVQTLSDLILNNMTKMIMYTTNNSLLRFHYIVPDPSAFYEFDPKTQASHEDAALLRQNKYYNLYSVEEKEKMYDEIQKQCREKLSDCAKEGVNDYITLMATKSIKGSSPKPVDFMFLWGSIGNIYSNKLIEILNYTGGSSQGGANSDSDNKAGVVPILFLDLAEIQGNGEEKADKQDVEKFEAIAKSININNFFAIMPNSNTGETNLTTTSRNGMLQIIEQAKRACQ